MAREAARPSFNLWRTKVLSTLQMGVGEERLKLYFTAAGSAEIQQIHHSELAAPQAGEYSCAFLGPDGKEVEETVSYQPPAAAPVRGADEFWQRRYQNLIEDIDASRARAEARCKDLEAERILLTSSFDEVSAQLRHANARIADLEGELEDSSLIDEETGSLILEAIDRFMGAGETKERVLRLMDAIDKDPKLAERLLKAAPDLVTDVYEACGFEPARDTPGNTSVKE